MATVDDVEATELGQLFLTPTDGTRHMQAAVALLTIYDGQPDHVDEERARQLRDFFHAGEFTAAEAAQGLLILASVTIDALARRADDWDRAGLLQDLALRAAARRL